MREPGRHRRAARAVRAGRRRAHRAGGHEPRLLHQRGHPGRGAPSPTSRTGRARSASWTGTRRRASSRWTCGRSTWTSTAAAGSSGCWAAPGVAFLYARPDLLADARARGRRAGSRTASSSGSIPRRSSCTTTRAGSRPARRRSCRSTPSSAGSRSSRSSARAEIRRRTMALTEDLIAARSGRGPPAEGGARPEERTAHRHAPERRPARRRPPAGRRGHHRRRAARPRAGLPLLLQRARRPPGRCWSA